MAAARAARAERRRSAGADGAERQQLIQEFFFHLVSAIEILAQAVNSVRELAIPAERVSISGVADAVRGNPLEQPLRALYASTREQPLPDDPYDGDGLMFRI